MCAALVVLCLVLFSLNMTSGLLARYTTRGMTNGGARTAEFMVAVRDDINGTIQFEQGTSTFDSENNLYKVEVTNKSETAVRYTIEMEFPKGTLKDSAGTGEGYLTVNHVTAYDEHGKPTSATPITTITLATTANGKDIVTFEGEAIDPNAAASVTEGFTFTVDLVKFYSKYTGSSLSTGTIALDFDTFVKFVQVD